MTRYADVPDKLKELHDQGYKIVIFCNHSPIGRVVKPEPKERGIIDSFSFPVST